MWTFYILYSPLKNKFYIGYTGESLVERLRKHNTNHNGFTGGAGDWVIVFSELHLDKKSAYRREREVKGWKSRIMIEKLIAEK
jgi:putative endonuclease